MDFLTIEMAAERLLCAPETVRRILRRGELSGIKLGKFWRIPGESLRQLNFGKSSKKTETDLFAPPTAEEIERGLRALANLGRVVSNARGTTKASPLDLEGQRGDVYGYREHEDEQR